MMRGKDLRDRPTRIIGNQIDRVDPERVQHLGDHLRLRRERDILRWRDLGEAEAHQVDRDAAPPMLDALDDVAPVIAVERHAVNKERDRTPPLIEIRDAAGFDLGEAAATVKCLDIHARTASVVAERF